MKKFTKNQLNVVKEWLDLRKYMSYCYDCGYDPSDSKNKQKYGKVLLEVYKWNVAHGHLEK